MEDLFSCGHSCHVCERGCGFSFHGLTFKVKHHKRLTRSWVFYRFLVPDYIPFHDGFHMELEAGEHAGNGSLPDPSHERAAEVQPSPLPSLLPPLPPRPSAFL